MAYTEWFQVDSTLSLQQSEIANIQAEEAVRQGTTMMVFTAATIFFVSLNILPLQGQSPHLPNSH